MGVRPAGNEAAYGWRGSVRCTRSTSPGRLSHSLEPIRWASAFRYYGAPLRDGIDPLYFIGLTAVGVLLLTLGASLLSAATSGSDGRPDPSTAPPAVPTRRATSSSSSPTACSTRRQVPRWRVPHRCCTESAALIRSGIGICQMPCPEMPTDHAQALRRRARRPGVAETPNAGKGWRAVRLALAPPQASRQSFPCAGSGARWRRRQVWPGKSARTRKIGYWCAIASNSARGARESTGTCARAPGASCR